MRKLLSILAGLLSVMSFTVHAETPPETPFTLTTTAFLDQGALPVLYTCDGKDISPQLDWVNAPAKTQSLALMLVDPDAPSGAFYHWVIYNIPKTVATFAEGQDKNPAGAIMGKNSWDKPQYNGPCPPKGSAHTYVFTLYALDTKLSIPAGADGKTVVNAMQKHILGKVELTTVYSRWIK